MSSYSELIQDPSVQRKLNTLLDSRVYVYATDIVEYILQKSYEDPDAPFSYEDIENQYPDKSDEIEELEEKIDALYEEQEKYPEPEQMKNELDEEFDIRYDEWNKRDDEFREKIEELECEKYELEDQQGTPQEAYEWWEVESGFADELYERGEIVIRGWHTYWGRQTTGQSISMDDIIFEIANDWGWLEQYKK